MKTTAIADTKGGVGKTTVCANLGAFCADAGLRTLLIDLDPTQPSLSSYYPLLHEAEGGIYDMLASNVIDPARIISSTTISNLSLILSNDVNNQLNNLLLQAPDGRLRLNHLTPAFQDQFDLVLIDTQGAKSVLVEMAALASDLVVSPLEPNMLAAREFNRGTLQMLDGLRAYERLGMKIPPVKIVFNSTDLTNDAKMIEQSVREVFKDSASINVLESTVPAAVVFRNAASLGKPAHRLEYRQPAHRESPSALAVIRRLAIEVFPEWRDRFELLTQDAVISLVKGAR